MKREWIHLLVALLVAGAIIAVATSRPPDQGWLYAASFTSVAVAVIFFSAERHESRTWYHVLWAGWIYLGLWALVAVIVLATGSDWPTIVPIITRHGY